MSYKTCPHRLARLYTEGKRFDDVMALLKSNSEFFSLIPKAKTAKIVRSILSIVGTIPDSLDVQISLCKDVVQWCVAEKRTFLRQRIEAKVADISIVFTQLWLLPCLHHIMYVVTVFPHSLCLQTQLASLLQQQKKPSEALEVVDKLLVELKKLDDKQMLTETHLTESRIYHSLQNIPKGSHFIALFCIVQQPDHKAKLYLTNRNFLKHISVHTFLAYTCIRIYALGFLFLQNHSQGESDGVPQCGELHLRRAAAAGGAGRDQRTAALRGGRLRHCLLVLPRGTACIHAH